MLLQRLYLPSAHSLSALSGIAVAFQPTEDGTHLGLFYREKEQVFLLHLAWHHRLIREDAPQDEYVWLVPEIPTERANDVASYCRRLVKKYLSAGRSRSNIPYGFTGEGASIDAQGGVVLDASASGLTCSTFVMTVFASAGVELLQRDTWPVRAEDSDWQNKIVGLLEKYGADEQHIEKVRADVGRVRFRPAEVAGACAFSGEEMPVSYFQIEPIAVRLIEIATKELKS